MNIKHHSLIGALVLIAGLNASPAAVAEVTSIVSASPDSAEQGTLGQPVVIKGAGFDKTLREVKFLLPCTPEPCTGADGGITVTRFTVDADDTVTATIDVSSTAQLGTFYIAMTSRGRGGKGTTFKSADLFTVKLRPNQQLLSCGDVVSGHQGSCTCQFVWNGDDAFLPTLLEDCVTSETLYIKHRFRGEEGGSADGNGQTTISAVPCGTVSGQNCSMVTAGNFSGSSVISNTYHRANIRFLDIKIDDLVIRGCGSGGIEAAVSFVLDVEVGEDGEVAGTPDPTTSFPEDNPDPLYRNTVFHIDNIGIYNDGAPLCNGIEVVRTSDYTEAYTYNAELEARDWKVKASNNRISAGSYQQAGIVMHGIMPSESINPPAVFDNEIGAATCDHTNAPVGILFGNLPPDSANQVDGVVENNVINMTNGCNGIGIEIVGDPGGTQTMVNVNKNTISGAYLGVGVDGNVVEVNFSGNTLNGDGGPTGIDSDAQCTQTKGKPNRISGYDTDISDAGCF